MSKFGRAIVRYSHLRFVIRSVISIKKNRMCYILVNTTTGGCLQCKVARVGCAISSSCLVASVCVVKHNDNKKTSRHCYIATFAVIWRDSHHIFTKDYKGRERGGKAQINCAINFQQRYSVHFKHGKYEAWLFVQSSTVILRFLWRSVAFTSGFYVVSVRRA